MPDQFSSIDSAVRDIMGRRPLKLLWKIILAHQKVGVKCRTFHRMRNVQKFTVKVSSKKTYFPHNVLATAIISRRGFKTAFSNSVALVKLIKGAHSKNILNRRLRKFLGDFAALPT